MIVAISRRCLGAAYATCLDYGLAMKWSIAKCRIARRGHYFYSGTASPRDLWQHAASISISSHQPTASHDWRFDDSLHYSDDCSMRLIVLFTEASGRYAFIGVAMHIHRRRVSLAIVA